MNESVKKKKTTRRIVILCVTLIVVFFVLQILFNKRSIDNDMMKAASEINKKCPIMIDSITRFDNASALTGNVFQFNFTITNADKSDYDTTALQSAIKPVTLNSLKTDPKYKVYRNNNTTLSFTYHDKNGSYLCNFTISPGEYK